MATLRLNETELESEWHHLWLMKHVVLLCSKPVPVGRQASADSAESEDEDWGPHSPWVMDFKYLLEAY